MNDSCRFAMGSFSVAGAKPFTGMIMSERVVALSALGGAELEGTLLDVLARWEDALAAMRDAARRWALGNRMIDALAVPVHTLQVHAPYVPRQIFAVGANYRQHVVELIMADPDMRSAEMAEATSEADRRRAAEAMMDERAANAQPYCFSKLPTSLAGPFDPLEIPNNSTKVDWECELAVVIGRRTRNVSRRDAISCIAGYAIANDVTARDLVFRRDVKALGTDWVSAKSQPGFTPFGPWVVPAQFVNPADLEIRLSVNDRLMQDERTSDMLISIDRQIEYLSSRVLLLPGDIICTGSPAGNGSHHGVFLRPGDRMVASITGLGAQRVLCVAPAPQ